MSSRDPELHLSDAAKADFRDILAYSFQMWGERQMDEYGNLLNSTMTDLTTNPKHGHPLPGSDIRSAKAGRHRIFYRISAVEIKVVRILHERMDLEPSLFSGT